MRRIECMHTQSECYKAQNHVTPVGIVVHSTGANNTTIRRYSQPSTDDPNHDELLKLIGTNTYNNHWNKEGVKTAVHYFVGKLADGSIATVQNLPENIACWGVGKGSKGSYNYAPVAHIQFEICEDGLTNQDYYNSVMSEAMDLCADICIHHNWTADVIVSHREASKLGYASNHSDIDHWLKKFGHDMNYFRSEVQKRIDAANKPIQTEYVPAVGDIVNFTGNVHYRSANGTTKYSCIPGLAEIKYVHDGKHPYNCQGIKGSSTVSGWVDAEFIQKYEEPVVDDPKQDVEVIEPVTPPVVEDNTKQNFIKQLITLIIELIKKLFTKKK